MKITQLIWITNDTNQHSVQPYELTRKV